MQLHIKWNISQKLYATPYSKKGGKIHNVQILEIKKIYTIEKIYMEIFGEAR
jgi:hypothetical protein